MQSSALSDHTSLIVPVSLRAYGIELGMRDGEAILTLAGDLDAAATDALRGILSCAAQMPGVLHVDAEGVLGADLDAFDPLLDVARERRRRRLPGVVLDSLSDTVSDLFAVLRIPTRPPVELGAVAMSG